MKDVWFPHQHTVSLGRTRNRYVKLGKAGLWQWFVRLIYEIMPQIYEIMSQIFYSPCGLMVSRDRFAHRHTVVYQFAKRVWATAVSIPFLVLVFPPIFLASWLVFWRVEPTMLVARLASNTQELRANPEGRFCLIENKIGNFIPNAGWEHVNFCLFHLLSSISHW